VIVTSEHHRYCRGCGGQISQDDKVVKVASGHLNSDDGIDTFEETEDQVWGYMHRLCFLTAVGDPAAILEMQPAAA
jgi:hypothetical protein